MPYMIFISLLSAFLLAFSALVLFRQDKYWQLHIYKKRLRDKIIELPVKYITHDKLLREIRIFNSMKLVAATVNGVAAEYIKWVKAFVKDPGVKPEKEAYTKLFYAYACFVLANKVDDYFVKRRLTNNLLWVFAPSKKIVRRINPKWSGKTYYVYPPVPYKVFNGSFADMADAGFKTEEPTAVTLCDSYMVYFNGGIEIKRYDNFFEMRCEKEQKVTFIAAADKADWDCQISRGAAVCKNLRSGETKKYTIRGDRVRLATSILQKTDSLEIYLTFTGSVTVSINGAEKKLLLPREIEFNKKAEQLAAEAWRSQFVAGENLRVRFFETEKIIPSLRLFTLVYEITGAEVFLSVIDDFDIYKKVAGLFGGLNIVFLYSSGNEFVSKLVGGFIARDDIRGLNSAGVFMYFVDRVVTSADAIYFLTRMKQAGGRHREIGGGRPAAAEGNIMVNEVTGKSFPWTKTVILQNADMKAQTASVSVPVEFAGRSVISKRGQNVFVTGIRSGRTAVYKLPKDADVAADKEIIANRMDIVIKTRLMGFEQKKFPIIKNDGAVSVKERKKGFIKSLEDIRVESADSGFSGIFLLPVTEYESPQILAAVRAAARNADRKLFISILSARSEINADIWEWMVSKIIGVRLLRGNVQIVPDVRMTGDFNLSFVYGGRPYNFNIAQNNGGCSIDYANNRQNNFLQVDL